MSNTKRILVAAMVLSVLVLMSCSRRTPQAVPDFIVTIKTQTGVVYIVDETETKIGWVDLGEKDEVSLILRRKR